MIFLEINNFGNDSSTYWLGPVATFFAAIGATLIGSIFALKQLRTNNITNARLKWLENLKRLFSEFIISAQFIANGRHIVNAIEKAFAKDLTKLNEERSKMLYKFIEHLTRTSANGNLILVNLNKDEKPHLKFQNWLREFVDKCAELSQLDKPNEEPFKSKYADLIAFERKLVTLAQIIFKLEWEKTKGGVKYNKWYNSEGKRLEREAEEL